MKRLNNKGISHLLVPLLVVVAVGIVGTYLLVSSHADSVNPSSTAETLVANPANPAVPIITTPDESQVIDAIYGKAGEATASAAKTKGVKYYNLTVIGKKDGGPCTGSKTTSGCKPGTSTYHRVSTSQARLHVWTNMDGTCKVKVNGVGTVPVKISKEKFHRLAKIDNGFKAKCSFAKGQYYNFYLTDKKKFVYWGSAKKRMVAYDVVGTNGVNGSKYNFMVLGSNQ